DEREFDYFILALQWAGTSCRSGGACCPYNGCCKADSPTQFTIHGLRPEYSGGERPSCCTGGSFDPDEIMPFFGKLVEYWPTYRCALEQSCNNRKEILWGQQYEKHGTCASPVIKGEWNYFKKTLKLFMKYNVDKALEDAGIVASNSKMYDLKDIVVAVESAVGARPKLRCDEEGLVQKLSLCFDKDFKPRDCVQVGSCPRYVSLPEIPD
uniref:Trichomaglin n=1 Tax=Trichosanthes lepiniana TaxID=282652 RepID=E0CX00_TRILE|nr:Chain A, trichomaglin [Trichosanthes lepiniana]